MTVHPSHPGDFEPALEPTNHKTTARRPRGGLR